MIIKSAVEYPTSFLSGGTYKYSKNWLNYIEIMDITTYEQELNICNYMLHYWLFQQNQRKNQTKRGILNYAECPVQVKASYDNLQNLPIYWDSFFQIIATGLGLNSTGMIFFYSIVILLIIDD